jgi:5-formyltetrahydrofolate cyclo-ligase
MSTSHSHDGQAHDAERPDDRPRTDGTGAADRGPADQSADEQLTLDRRAAVDRLRREVRARRRALPPEARDAAAAAVAEHLDLLEVLSRPGRIGTYLPVDGELDPNVVLPSLRERGWQVHLPVIGDSELGDSTSDDSASMRFGRWNDDTALRPNRYGIAEPEPGDEDLAATDLDVLLVPAVAVDVHGNRIGFGAGFYDRALATRDRSTDAGDHTDAGDRTDATTPPRRVALIGVVYDLQVVDDLEPNEWDVPLDLIVTESRLIG